MDLPEFAEKGHSTLENIEKSVPTARLDDRRKIQDMLTLKGASIVRFGYGTIAGRSLGWINAAGVGGWAERCLGVAVEGHGADD